MPSAIRYFKSRHTVRYDPSIRDYVVLSNGDTDAMHYVDQRVALCLNILQGTLSGDSRLGNALRSIKRLNSADAVADAKRAIVNSLEDCVNDGEITILDIVVRFPSKGRMDIFVTYRNEVLSKSLQPKSASFTIGGNSNG